MAELLCSLKKIGGGEGYSLVVTCTSGFAGSPITCTDGITTLTDTCPSVSPYEVTFILPNTGTWYVSGIFRGTTYTESVLVENFDAELNNYIDIIVDFYSAANDTVSYTSPIDSSTHTVTTDSDGHATATITIEHNGNSIAFTSSVAKDPNNLSNSYSKTINLTSATTSIKVMPDSAVYWYGYKAVSFTAKAALSSAMSAYTKVVPTVTFNTNSLTIEVEKGGITASHGGSLFSDTAIDVSNYSVIKSIAHNFFGGNSTGKDGAATRLSTSDGDGYTTDISLNYGNDAIPSTSTPALVTSNSFSISGNRYLLVQEYITNGSPNNVSTVSIDAIWFE